MFETEAPVEEALILICRKCGEKLQDRKKDENPSRELQHALKSAIKAEFGKRRLRAVLTDCLDLCPKKAITIAYMDLQQRPGEFFILSEDDLDLEPAKILRKIRDSHQL